MSIVPEIFDWCEKFGIKRLLNTPCGGGGDCVQFENRGIHALGVNVLPPPTAPCTNHVQDDLNTWKPDGEWDAAYINCLFCTSVTGDKATIVRNVATWPIKYVLIYDTISSNADTEFDWRPHFKEAGWVPVASQHAENGVSLVEIWRRV